MKIVKPVCIGMVLGVLVGLCRQTYITEAGGISLPGIAIGILCFVLLQKFKLSVPKVIGIAAVLGLVCFGVFNLSVSLRSGEKPPLDGRWHRASDDGEVFIILPPAATALYSLLRGRAPRCGPLPAAR